MPLILLQKCENDMLRPYNPLAYCELKKFYKKSVTTLTQSTVNKDAKSFMSWLEFWRDSWLPEDFSEHFVRYFFLLELLDAQLSICISFGSLCMPHAQ